MAVVVGHPNNRIHIYSLVDYQLKFCFAFESSPNKILNVNVSKKNRFLALFFSDYNMSIYYLSSDKKSGHNCKCLKELFNDDNTFQLEKDRPKSFFSKAVTNLKVKIILL